MDEEPPDDDEPRRTLRDGLSERERRVLRERFGIDPAGEFSLHEVLRQFETTRARIAAIEAAVAARLHGPAACDPPNGDDAAAARPSPVAGFVCLPPCANDSEFAAADGPQDEPDGPPA